MRKAWIENDVIRDIAQAGDPFAFYHPDIAKHYDTEVPDEAENGDGWVNGQLVKPAPLQPPEPPALTPPQVSSVEFKMLFTSAERVAIREARKTDAVVDDFFDLVEDPRLTYVDLALPSVQGALQYLVAVELLTEERVPEILSGKVL